MRFATQPVVAWIVWTTLGAVALAAEPATLKGVEERLAIERADALAGHKLFDRAEAILRQVVESQSAASAVAQKKLDALIEEHKKADPSFSAPMVYRTALSEARKTCRPLFVFFGRETCGNCNFTKGNLAKAPISSLLVHFHQVMLECDAQENRGLLSRLRAGKDMTVLPFIFYVSPHDELIDCSTGAQDNAELKAKLIGVLKQYPPLNPQQLAKLSRSLKTANEEMLKGNCGAANRLYYEIARSDMNIPVVDEAKASFLAIGEQADRLLQEAQACNDKPAEAALYLAILTRKFAGTKAAATAKEELAKYKNNPDVRAVLQAEAPAEKTPAAAPADSPKEAAVAPVKEATPPPPPQPPKPKADPAKSLLNLARNLIANHRMDKAAPLLDRILKEYPDSPAASDARDLLRGQE